MKADQEAEMCGRFTLTVRAEEVRQVLQLEQLPENWQPRYNIAPTQQIAAVLASQPNALTWLRWGLVPGWSRREAQQPLLINARAETLTQKPAFRAAFAQRRCLILADGFYEWQKQSGGRRAQPYWFQRRGGGLFAFAGVWETTGEEMRTAAIVTCPANACVAAVHERMPVMLDFPKAWTWLSVADEQTLRDLLVPYPAEDLQAVAVGLRVNDAQHDALDCLMPV